MSSELCGPGYYFDMPRDICLPCSLGTYNHGINKVLDACYTIPEGAAFMFFNATDVVCRDGWVGAPIYEDGEYEEGCQDAGDGPTMPPSFDLCNLQWSNGDLPMICQCIMGALSNTAAPTMATYPAAPYPTFEPSPAISSQQQIIAPTPIHGCSNMCCYLWWVVLGILGIGRCILVLRASRRRRAPNIRIRNENDQIENDQIENDQIEVAMVAIPARHSSADRTSNIRQISEERAVLTRHDSLQSNPENLQ